MNKKQLLSYMIKVAIFASLSFILYITIKFPLPALFPAFLDIQFSNLPAIIGGFALGPVGGSLIVIIRTLIKLPLSTTACVGELADLIIGLATVLTSSIIYNKFKTKKGALLALGCGSIAWVLTALLSNWLITVPFFIKAYGFDKVFGMVINTIPFITNENFMFYYLVCAALPFNLLLSTVVSIITFLVYKRISILLKKI